MATINVIYKNINFEQYEDSFEKMVEMVYPARKKAILRLKNRKAAIMSLVTGLLLQDIVWEECNKSFESLAIDINENGKPYVVGCENFHFNISHSHNVLVIAYSNQELGVDIEILKENDLSVARRCFTKEEYDYIVGDAHPEDSLPVEYRFCKIWTMKEAYLKYKGTGITVPLNSFSVDPIKGKVIGEDVNITSQVIDGFMLSVCTSNHKDLCIKFA